MDDAAKATIVVSGTGTVSRPPDIVEISIGVEVVRSAVAEATDDAATLAAGVVDGLRAVGIDHDDMQTARYTVSTEYEHIKQRRRLVGYRVANALRITVRNIETMPDVLTAATLAGGDATTVHGIEFAHHDRAALRTEAREAAWSDAVESGRQLAELAGRTLGAAHRIVEGGSAAEPRPYMLTRAAGGGQAPPIEGGTIDETVSVSVEFELD